jgi:hypothetical protein
MKFESQSSGEPRANEGDVPRRPQRNGPGSFHIKAIGLIGLLRKLAALDQFQHFADSSLDDF